MPADVNLNAMYINGFLGVMITYAPDSLIG